jgi:hypothetical protein
MKIYLKQSDRRLAETGTGDATTEVTEHFVSRKLIETKETKS